MDRLTDERLRELATYVELIGLGSEYASITPGRITQIISELLERREAEAATPARCSFRKGWIGPCKNTAIKGQLVCAEHVGLCFSCGSPAAHDCEETLGPFVCGRLLCDGCEHTLRENGCTSGADLPPGLKDHCRKGEQVYEPWFHKPEAS